MMLREAMTGVEDEKPRGACPLSSKAGEETERDTERDTERESESESDTHQVVLSLSWYSGIALFFAPLTD